MRGNLYPTTVYLDESLKKQVALLSLATGRPKAEVIRDALKKGVKTIEVKPSSSTKALLDLAREVRKLLKNEKLPQDLSERHNYYTWEEK